MKISIIKTISISFMSIICLASCSKTDAEVCFDFGSKIDHVVDGEPIHRIITQDEFNSCLSAAKNNDAFSERVLGAIYDDGLHGVEQDPDEAIKWYIRAINNGDKESLGMLIVDCIFKYQDFDQASALVKKGSEIGLLSSSEVQKYNGYIRSAIDTQRTINALKILNTQSY